MRTIPNGKGSKELNENEMRNDLNRYIANNQPRAYKKFPIINGTNFFKFLELAKNDDSIFTYFTQKSRTGDTKEVTLQLLAETQTDDTGQYGYR